MLVQALRVNPPHYSPFCAIDKHHSRNNVLGTHRCYFVPPQSHLYIQYAWDLSVCLLLAVYILRGGYSSWWGKGNRLSSSRATPSFRHMMTSECPGMPSEI
jgi:hypothetical protein